MPSGFNSSRGSSKYVLKALVSCCCFVRSRHRQGTQTGKQTSERFLPDAQVKYALEERVQLPMRLRHSTFFFLIIRHNGLKLPDHTQFSFPLLILPAPLFRNRVLKHALLKISFVTSKNGTTSRLAPNQVPFHPLTATLPPSKHVEGKQASFLAGSSDCVSFLQEALPRVLFSGDLISGRINHATLLQFGVK